MISIPLTRPLSMGELLDVTFRLYRKHFWKLVLTAGGLMFPLSLISNGLQLVQLKFLGRMMGMAAIEGGDFIAPPAWLVGLQLLVGLLSGIAFLISFIAIIWMADRLLHGESPGVIESWRSGLRFFLRYLAIILLLAGVMGLSMIGFIIIMLIPCLGFIMVLASSILYIYFYVRLILTPVALVVEDCGPIEAIKTAWHTSQGFFWRIAGYGFLLWLLAAIFYLIPLILMEYFFLVNAIEPSSTFLLASFGMNVLVSIINILWTPVYLAGFVVLYYDLKLRHHPSSPLEDRIEALEAEASDVEAFPTPEPEMIPDLDDETSSKPEVAPGSDGSDVGDASQETS